MISDAITMYEFVTKNLEDRAILTAYFKWDGTRISGNERITVEKVDSEKGSWFYKINDVEDFVFLRIPTHMSAVIEIVGMIAGETAKDSNYFRYVGVPTGQIFGGVLPNVKVDFMVFGYKPNDLLNRNR